MFVRKKWFSNGLQKIGISLKTKYKMMRELLNTLDSILLEGVGLTNRKPGDVFENANGDTIIFQDIAYYPDVGKFQSQEEMIAAVDAMGLNIKWVNKPVAASMAFIIATFSTNDGSKYYLGKYFKDIKASRRDNDFAHSNIPGGFKYVSGRGASENSGYKPSEVLTEFNNLTIDQVAQQIIKKFGEGSDEAVAVKIFMASKDFPVTIPAGRMNFNAFKVYMCEMLQPLAFIKGMTLKGNAQHCVDLYFGKGKNFADCTASFNSTTGGLLADSILKNSDGKVINISTKDVSGGAKTSAQNIQIELEKIRETPGGEKLLQKYQNVLKIISAFGKNSHYSAPLTIAVDNDLITKEESMQVMRLKDGNYGLGYDPVGKGLLSKRLEKWYTDYMASWHKPVVPIHTIMLIIATKVCNYVNLQTNFSAAAAEILNQGALIQVNTDIRQSGDNFIFNGLNCHYPGSTVTGVVLTTEKAYWTIGAQGNMTFKLIRNGSSPKKEDPTTGAVAPGGDGADSLAVPSVITKKTVKMRPKHAVSLDTPETPGPGRKKR
jgi:hypothetical protein